MQPKRWRVNLPFRDYRFEYEDTIPAMAATIGKVVMVGAIAATCAQVENWPLHYRIWNNIVATMGPIL